MKLSIKSLIKERFAESWDTKDILTTLTRLMFFYLKGCYERLYFKNSAGLVLVGRGASIRYARNLKAGKDLIIEDYAEINCISNKGIILGDRVTIGKFAIIRPTNAYGGNKGEGLSVGNNSSIGPFAYIGCSGFIEIGNNVIMGPRVGLYAENHIYSDLDIPIKEQGVVKEFIKIEDDCWIASNVNILAGVTIGRGSIIASGSIVTKSVPAYSIVAGVPAKVIKSRA